MSTRGIGEIDSEKKIAIGEGTFTGRVFEGVSISG